MSEIGQLHKELQHHAKSDADFQAKSLDRDTDINRRLAEMKTKLDTVPTKDEIGVVVADAMRSVFMSKGKMLYTIIVATGGLALALTAIFGGFKAVGAFLFFRP